HDVVLPPFLRLGSWIGGDRDGNPFVNGATLSYAIDRQASVAFAHYLDEIHRLGAELSLSTRLVTPSPELLALAERERIAVLQRELASPRLLHSPHLAYSDLARSELAVLETAADIHRRYGAAALPNYVISKCQSVSD